MGNPFAYSAGAHPRVGGEHNNIVPAPGSSLGSSPRRRGAQGIEYGAATNDGLIPA